MQRENCPSPEEQVRVFLMLLGRLEEFERLKAAIENARKNDNEIAYTNAVAEYRAFINQHPILRELLAG